MVLTGFTVFASEGRETGALVWLIWKVVTRSSSFTWITVALRQF